MRRMSNPSNRMETTVKKIGRAMAIALATTAVVSCTTKEVRYIEATSAPTTTELATTTTRPRPTTTQPSMSDSDWFIAGIYEVMDGRVYLDDYDMLETGWLVCDALDSGASIEEIQMALFEAAPIPGNSQDLLIAVSVSATTFLCPEWSWVWD